MSNQPTVVPLARFRGYVTHIDSTSFEARIWEEDKAGAAQEEQEASILRKLVTALDEELLVLGAFFTLEVVAKDPLAPAECHLKFAREPCYTAEDLKTARRRAEELLRDLQVE